MFVDLEGAGRGFFISEGVAVVRLNRIYTKAGDGGDTRLVGGQRVRKDTLRIEAYGTIDEVSACLGLARTALIAPAAPAGADALAAVLVRIQNELFNLGSDLATLPEDRRPQQPVIEPRHVDLNLGVAVLY